MTLNKTERKAALEALRANPLIKPDAAIIPFSALTGEGKDDCLKAMLGVIQ